MSCLGQANRNLTAIFFTPLPTDQTTFLQIVKDHGHVAIGYQKFVPDITLAHGTKKVQSLQRPELTLGKPIFRQRATSSLAQHLPCSADLNKSIQCATSCFISSVMGWHSAILSSSNRKLA